MVPVTPPAESDVPVLDAHRSCHRQVSPARAVSVAPLDESDVPALDAHVQHVVELFCWFMLLRLLIALSVITVFVFGTLLIAAMVVGGPTLLCALADIMTDAFREVLILCNQFIQDPGQKNLFHKAWRGLNM
ncbi:hypothetical protein MRX96_055629 [Rhipicephalus microplus]